MECVITPEADALRCINWLGDSRVTLTGERDSNWSEFSSLKTFFSTRNHMQ